MAQVLRLEPPTLRQARRELLGLGLIAYQKPLYQLLSLEAERTAEPPPRPSRDDRDEPDPEPPPSASRPRGLPLKATVEWLLQQSGGSAP